MTVISGSAKARAAGIPAAALLAVAILLGSERAAIAEAPDDIYSANDFGGVGLLNMRTARFAPDGNLEIGASFVNPYRRYYITWQIFPRLEATFRYLDPTNDIFGGETIDQSQGKFFLDIIKFKQGGTTLDRGADLKFKLWSESKYRPAVAVGIQDGLGTGLFSAEYVVASKRFHDLDVTVGLGWGYFASRGTFKNPFRILSGRFRRRGGSVTTGGNALFGSFFGGERVGLFGGVEYYTPIMGLSVKAEYNSADPKEEPNRNALSEALPIGIAVNYRPSNWGDLSIGLERGNSVMLRGSIRYNLHEPGMPKFDLLPPEVKPRPRRSAAGNTVADDPAPRRPQPAVDSAGRVFDELAASLAEKDLELEAMDARALALTIAVASDRIQNQQDRDQRLFRQIFAAVPDWVRTVRLMVTGTDGRLGLLIQRAMVTEWRLVDIAFQRARRAGVAIGEISLDGEEMIVAVAPGRERQHRRPARARRLAASLVGLLHAGVERIVLKDDAGDSGEFARRDLAEETIMDRIGPDLEAEGFPVTTLEVRERSAVVIVDAPPWGLRDDYRDLAKMAYVSVNDIVDDVTIVGRREDMEVARFTLRRPEHQPPISALAEAPAADPAEGDEPELPAAAPVELHGDPATVATAIFQDLGRWGFFATAVHFTDFHATIYVSGVRYRQAARNIGWVSRVASNHLPPSVEEITVVTIIGGVPVSKVSIIRSDLERAVTNRGSPEEILVHAKIEKPDHRVKLPEGTIRGANPFPSFVWSLRPQLKQHLGDPDTGVYLADVALLVTARLDLAPGLAIRAAYSRFVVGNLDKIRRDSDSVLPRVRSDLRLYLQEGRSSLVRLQADYVFSPAKDVFARVSAGIFEWMFGGVGGEVLYRPYGANWAIGADINWVKQRGFNQGFGFREYEVVTGHVTLNYDVPIYDVLVTIDVGRYLAKDRGATLTLSREFRSGVRVGAWATKTNVSAAEFGEGSFDKGFFIIFPLEMFMLQSSRGAATFAFRPLSRDGGQRLIIGPRLYDLSREGNAQNILRDWDRILD